MKPIQSSSFQGLALLFIFGAVSLLAACGGGGDSPKAAGVKSGRFLDSVVEGLDYDSGSQSGLTDANGTFQSDDTRIAFSVGDILLGEGNFSETMSPMDLVPGAVDETNSTVTNITRFLLSLDDDGKPENGIRITRALRDAALGKSLNFKQNTAEFERDPKLIEVLSSLTRLRSAGERGLYPLLAAQAHLKNTLLGIQSFSLTVIVSGQEGGRVQSTPEGIDCGLVCTKAYPVGTEVVLSPIPLSGAAATAWRGDPDCEDGTVTMTGNRTCRIAFQLPEGKIAAGGAHSCQLLPDGGVQCWGLNDKGQLGDGTLLSASSPVRVQGLQTATAVSAGAGFSCALLADGRVQCWGWNAHGQLGNGSRSSSTIPVPVSGLQTATALSSGQAHSCALLADGGIQCWGLNLGRLGDGTYHTSGPVSVSNIQGATAVSAGGTHSCALLIDGSIWCWGASGPLGNNKQSGAVSPVLVQGIRGATAVSAGGAHTCALLSDARVKCWGDNTSGQLGNGGFAPLALVPVGVDGLEGVTALSSEAAHSCALLSDGSVQCWGDYDPQATAPSLVPQVLNLSPAAAAISSGGDHGCALFFSGQFECWGKNDQGQLGR